MEDKVYYKVSEKELINLLAVRAIYDALDSGGVDNWSWYGEALQGFWDDYVESYPAVIKECEYDERDWFDNLAIGRYELHNYERIE